MSNLINEFIFYPRICASLQDLNSVQVKCIIDYKLLFSSSSTLYRCCVYLITSHFLSHFPHNLTSHLIPALRCHFNDLIWGNIHFSMLWIVQLEKSPFFHDCENGLFLLITPSTMNYWPRKGSFLCYEVPYWQLTLRYVLTLHEFRFGGDWVYYIKFCLVRLVYATSFHFFHILRSAPIYGAY